MGCARKVVRSLTTIPGVASVKTDIRASTAEVTPQKDRPPSPRALWEAIEKAGYKPLRLEGPGGKFTAKPKS
jgi:copper chaperone CopZ